MSQREDRDTRRKMALAKTRAAAGANVNVNAHGTREGEILLLDSLEQRRQEGVHRRRGEGWDRGQGEAEEWRVGSIEGIRAWRRLLKGQGALEVDFGE